MENPACVANTPNPHPVTFCKPKYGASNERNGQHCIQLKRALCETVGIREQQIYASERKTYNCQRSTTKEGDDHGGSTAAD